MILTLLSLYHAYHSFGFANAYPIQPCVQAMAAVYPREEIVYITNYRSTFDIIWSCFATIFACTWVAMHPNVPKDRSTWWTRSRKHIYLFMAALLGPELVIPQAMNDWRRAQVLRSQMPETYTLAQCHFLGMGGVVFRTQNGRLEKFDASKPTHLEAVKKHPIDVDEISARSKSSSLGKTLVVIQVSWFIIQCIARGAQRLAITELEVTTLGYAVLNGVLYALWWHKPAGVEAPLIIDLPQALSTRDEVGPFEEKTHNGATSQVTGFFVNLQANQWEILLLLIGGVVGSIFGALHCIALSFHFPSHVAFMLWKVCALVLTISPLSMAVVFALGLVTIGLFFTQTVGSVFFGPGIIGYTAARVILVVVSFWALTSIPQTGHQTVTWTKFIPHL